MTNFPSTRRKALLELAGLFLKLGTIAFGGPAAHIAMMEREVVAKRGWLSHEEFLDLLGASNLIPGPNSTEMAIHIGHRRAGWPGLLLAGLCFILPAACIVTLIAWGYVRYGKLPQIEGIFYGIKPVIIAIVAQALWKLGQTAIKTPSLAVLALAATILNILGLHELIVLFGSGAICVLGRWLARRPLGAIPSLFAVVGGLPRLPAVSAVAASAATAATPFSLGGLFFVFAKIGAVLFGSGYVLLAFLRSDLVERRHWITEAQLLDAIAVGQFTPGPVFTTATFIGYLLGGTRAALVATVAIFLPAFVFVAISAPLVPRIRRSPLAAALLDGVNVASLALMAVVTWQIGAAALVDWITVALAVSSGFFLFRYRINSVWLVLGGAAAGWILSALKAVR